MKKHLWWLNYTSSIPRIMANDKIRQFANSFDNVDDFIDTMRYAMGYEKYAALALSGEVIPLYDCLVRVRLLLYGGES